MSMINQYDAKAGSLKNETREKYQDLLTQYQSNCEMYWDFEIVPDFFKQSQEGTDPAAFNYLMEDFGKILSWEETFDKLSELNRNSQPNESYKIMFLARHGQGYHNLANIIYGQEEWDNKWSRLNGDGNMVWGPDPDLTELGIQQADDNRVVWRRQLDKGCKLPTKWFSSPFTRSVDTLIYTWRTIIDTQKVKPLIKENLREKMGLNTCDHRSDRTTIAGKYEPHGFIIEDGFPEGDIYCTADTRETTEQHAIRANKAFQDIFNNHDDEIISITSHSGTIRVQLLVLNHRQFAIGTGGMIPVFVKGTKKVNKNFKKKEF